MGGYFASSKYPMKKRIRPIDTAPSLAGNSKNPSITKNQLMQKFCNGNDMKHERTNFVQITNTEQMKIRQEMRMNMNKASRNEYWLMSYVTTVDASPYYNQAVVTCVPNNFFLHVSLSSISKQALLALVNDSIQQTKTRLADEHEQSMQKWVLTRALCHRCVCRPQPARNHTPGDQTSCGSKSCSRSLHRGHCSCCCPVACCTPLKWAPELSFK